MRAGIHNSCQNELLEVQGLNGWTQARRDGQAQAIHHWQPWKHSTGPRTASGKARSSMNAFLGAPRRRLRHCFARLNAELKAHQNAIEEIRVQTLTLLGETSRNS